MKRTLLLVSLLFSVPVLADNFESLKAGIDTAQANKDAAQQRVADLNGQLEASKTQLASVSGKAEYVQEIERLNAAHHKLAAECNEAVAACKAENKKLEEAASRCAGSEHRVVTEGGRMTLQKAEATCAAAPAKAARAPYAQRGTEYPRALKA